VFQIPSALAPLSPTTRSLPPTIIIIIIIIIIMGEWWFTSSLTGNTVFVLAFFISVLKVLAQHLNKRSSEALLTTTTKRQMRLRSEERHNHIPKEHFNALDVVVDWRFCGESVAILAVDSI
jgi:hypothetical protein